MTKDQENTAERGRAIRCTAIYFETQAVIHDIDYYGDMSYIEYTSVENLRDCILEFCFTNYFFYLTSMEVFLIIEHIRRYRSVSQLKEEGCNECHCEFFKRLGDWTFCRHLDLMNLQEKALRLKDEAQ